MPWRAFVQVTKGIGMKEVGGADHATTDTATALSFSLADAAAAADAAVDVASAEEVIRDQVFFLSSTLTTRQSLVPPLILHSHKGSLPQMVREQPWALAKRFRHQPDRRTMSMAIMQYISRVSGALRGRSPGVCSGCV
mmetsp:Transcript_102655/g.294146  ORF Transcript_102655/g.294146 Transcript_102655/m.294146 type:complete len:138 (-) Transcript_102655:813-1226(-)